MGEGFPPSFPEENGGDTKNQEEAEKKQRQSQYGLHSQAGTELSAEMKKEMKAPVAYADDFLYRSFDRGVVSAVNVPIDIEQMMVYEKERAAALWQEVPGVETPVPMFYFSSAIIEPGFVAPTVPPAPSPPPLSVCKTKLVEVDAMGSAGTLTATKLQVLQVLLDTNFGPKRPIENLDAAAWSTSGLSYSKGSAISLVAMDDMESLKEAAESTEGFLAKAANGYTGGSSKSLAGALKVAGKPAMSILGAPAACFARETTACRIVSPAAAKDAFAACFGGSSSPVAERVAMDALVAGDAVLASDAAATRVVVNQHAGVKATAPMLTLHFGGGALALTPDHVLLVDGAHAPARLAAVGSVLSSGRKVTAITRNQQGIVNPITASGTILAAGPQGEPVVAATAPEWSADVLLSGYPKYTLSFNLAFLFPASVQAFYNAALEPFFSVAVPRLEQIKAAAPLPMVAAGFALGDAVLAAGLFVFAFGKLAVVAAAAALVGRVVARKA